MGLRNAKEVKQVWLMDEPDKKYQMIKKWRFIKYHAYAKEYCSKAEHRFKQQCVITVRDPAVIEKYYTEGTFKFNGEILKEKGDEQVGPTKSEIKKQLNRLKFEHGISEVLPFLSEFERLVGLLELDEDLKKLELQRFFKIGDRARYGGAALAGCSFMQMKSEFYGLYNQEAQTERSRLENLTWQASASLERFLCERFEYFERYRSKPTLESIKVSIMDSLPVEVRAAVNLNQATLSSKNMVISYILVKAERVRFATIPVRKRDERSYDQVLQDMNVHMQEELPEYESEDSDVEEAFA